MSNKNKRLVKTEVKGRKKRKYWLGVAVVVPWCCLVGVFTVPSAAVKVHNKVSSEKYSLVNSSTGKERHKTIKYKPSDVVTTIGDYSLEGLELGGSYSVTDEAIKEYADYFLSKYSTSVEYNEGHPVEEGETVTIIYDGKVGNTTIDSSNGEEEDVTLGEGKYVSALEEGITGHSVGETFSVDVVLPDDYSDKAVRGKTAVYEVTITKSCFVKEYDYDSVEDSFLADNTEYETKEDFWDYCKEYVTGMAEETKEKDKRQAVLDQVLEASEYSIPDDLLQQECDVYEEQFMNLYCLDSDLETYVSDNYGITLEEFREEVEEDVSSSFTNVVVCERLAEIKGYTLSEEYYQNYVDGLIASSSYGTEEEESLYEVYTTSYCKGEDYLRRMALCECVLESLMEEATFVYTEGAD